MTTLVECQIFYHADMIKILIGDTSEASSAKHAILKSDVTKCRDTDEDF